MNQLIKELETGKGTVYTWNRAISHASTGSPCLDYFSKSGSYRYRTQNEVNADMSAIFAEDVDTALRLVFYNRMITRKIKGFDVTDTVQRGQGQRDEFIKSLCWLEKNKSYLLYDNLHLIPSVGKWSDLWYESATTGLYHYINPIKVYNLIKSGLYNDYHRHLLAKYLPKIRSKRNTRTDRHRRLNVWARGLCQFLNLTEKQYRQLKSNPSNTAHLYQRQMCDKDWKGINFNMIPGKALFNLLSQSGKDNKNTIERHSLEDRYLQWIKTQPIAKFTGYPYELYKAAKNPARSLLQRYTYNSQFEGLIEKAKDNVPEEILNKGVLCALDTSGSMGSMYNINALDSVAPIDICVGLGIYFSSLIEGHFKNHVMMFDDDSRFLKLNGEFCDKCDQIFKYGWAMGSTNFQSVIEEIVRVRKNCPEIPVEDYPQILLVISDMQFNQSGDNVKTNHEVAMNELQKVGLPRMTIIYWQVNGRFTEDVPATLNTENTILISGYDGSIVTSLLGSVGQKNTDGSNLTPKEMMELALNQEILNKFIA